MNCSVSPSMSRRCRMSVAISRMRVSVSFCALCSWLHFHVLAASSSCLLAAFSGVSVCLCVRVLTACSRHLFAALSGVSFCLCFRLLAEFRSRLSAASWGLERLTLSHVGCLLKACFGCLVWLLGLPLCPCTDCVFKVGRVSFTSVSRLLGSGAAHTFTCRLCVEGVLWLPCLAPASASLSLNRLCLQGWASLVHVC